MAGPLEGIRVVDCSRGIAGARMTWFLADYGCDVIWVEPPGGDPWRDELAVSYSVYNRNKRSIELGLSDPADHQTLLDLLETADVFVETWRPGVAERLGLGYETVRSRVPRLVYCSISGYGPSGPYDDLPGYGALVHAATGMMGAQFGHREGPIFLGLPQASNGAAYMGLIGVLAALYRREDDGWGRRVETSLVDGVLAYMAQAWGYGDASPSVVNMASFGVPRFVTRTFLCADHEWLGLSTFGGGAFDRLMKALGIDDRIPPVEGAGVTTQLSPVEASIVFNEIPEIFLSQPRQVWLDRLIDADVAAIPVLRPGQVFDEPQAVHNKMVIELTDSVLGPIQQVAAPITFEQTPGAGTTPAPTVGQHTEEVRRELRERPAHPRGPQPGRLDDRPLLDGVKILDLGHWYAGPFSSRLLAGLGADVIKLEPPVGDGMRSFDRAFAAAQAGKRSIAADLKDPQLASLRRRLLEWADVVQHNLRVGVAERLGLSSEEVRSVNPQIVYLYAPGWGSTGPETGRQSFAPLMSGYVGAAYELGGEFNPPIYPAANEDSGAGMLGAVTLLMALLHRKRTGLAQHVELPQLNSTMSDVAHIVRRPDGSVVGAGALDPLQYRYRAVSEALSDSRRVDLSGCAHRRRCRRAEQSTGPQSERRRAIRNPGVASGKCPPARTSACRLLRPPEYRQATRRPAWGRRGGGRATDGRESGVHGRRREPTSRSGRRVPAPTLRASSRGRRALQGRQNQGPGTSSGTGIGRAHRRYPPLGWLLPGRDRRASDAARRPLAGRMHF